MMNMRITNRPMRSRVVTQFSRREIALAFVSVPLQKRHHHHHDHEPPNNPSSEIEPQASRTSDKDKVMDMEKDERRAQLASEQRERSQAWQREFVETASGIE